MQHAAEESGAARAMYALCTLTGCTGVQSALDPQSPGAQRIADLFWVMTIGGGIIYVAFVGLSLYAMYARREQHSQLFARRLIIGGAVVVPTVLLAALLIHGLQMLPLQLAPAPQGSLRIHVSGEQWWWRIRYHPPDGPSFETANEIRLPVDTPVQFELESPDVIHSFWVPNLAGKVDMIPGRMTRLALTAARVGDYRGVCAEYCGTSHAWMAFPVVVLDRRAFSEWLADQTVAPSAPVDPLLRQGHSAFMENGCGACHTVRGTAAQGVIGPDLTHVGSRGTIGAGLFARNESTLARWIASTDQVKPGVHMPSFGMLSTPTLHALAAYLESLK